MRACRRPAPGRGIRLRNHLDPILSRRPFEEFPTRFAEEAPRRAKNEVVGVGAGRIRSALRRDAAEWVSQLSQRSLMALAGNLAFRRVIAAAFAAAILLEPALAAGRLRRDIRIEVLVRIGARQCRHRAVQHRAGHRLVDHRRVVRRRGVVRVHVNDGVRGATTTGPVAGGAVVTAAGGFTGGVAGV